MVLNGLGFATQKPGGGEHRLGRTRSIYGGYEDLKKVKSLTELDYAAKHPGTP